MKLSKIYEYLDKLSPFELQESWDNSGLLVGEMNDEVNCIYLSLDIDDELLDEIPTKSLLITHHPLIFKGLKKIDFSLYPSSLIKKMIKKDISLISMHTNFDTTHLNKYVATEVLGYKDIQCDGHICYFNVDCSLDALSLHVKNSLGLEVLKRVVGKKKIKKCALTTGSGGDLISEVKADCFLSGDFKYHQALEAKENKLSLIDIGHYESECHFSACLSENLEKLPLKVIMSNSKNPFEYKIK
jgi:dinuclear metal center YbgI/SA1388 family protein